MKYFALTHLSLSILYTLFEMFIRSEGIWREGKAIIIIFVIIGFFPVLLFDIAYQLEANRKEVIRSQYLSIKVINVLKLIIAAIVSSTLFLISQMIFVQISNYHFFSDDFAILRELYYRIALFSFVLFIVLRIRAYNKSSN